MVGNPKNMKYKIIGGSEVLEQPKGTFDRSGAFKPGKPGGGGYLWILFFVAAAMIIASQVKKESPGVITPGNNELFEKLPDKAKESFKEKYGQPDGDDSECELYYLVANSTMKRPCIKCPIWCMDPEKIQILVSKDHIYYIGKTCREQGKRKKEHEPTTNALDLEYQWVLRGTEGYITKSEQLHLKTYFTKGEAVKEGCHLFLPPGNAIGMSQKDWKRLLKELQ